ncbi:hypothetical protein CPB84DRAFT_1826578 [Gymnopilus junonius]|uniref:UBC core domain-containing protein n=1 Tax=Gymnopilus junonius TaxID=109634 RepID=A0A9P5TJR4_GYMJU|nr:hypothetical protein CPB84DRAFT_1826578 [Gymnopilus junonius]
MQEPEVVEEEEVVDPGRFDRFSLSNSLESLMDQSFLKIVQLRRFFGLGWAGAELLNSEVEKSQQTPETVLALKGNEIRKADIDERELARTTSLPHDPLMGLGPKDQFNLPLTAFCYLIRRLALCTRFCIVCHNKLHFDYEALKPYVCDNKLCSYQYYLLNRGPSLEYEIVHNSQTVDLLVSLAYVSAQKVMEDPLPIGLALRVPLPTGSILAQNQGYYAPNPAPEVPETLKTLVPAQMVYMRHTIAKLINTLPSIDEMKKHLQRKVKAGKSKPKLKDIDPNVLPAAWSTLRWIVGSCTAHIEVIESGEERIKNLVQNDSRSPDAEAKFKEAINLATKENSDAKKYPVIYSFFRHSTVPAEELAFYRSPWVVVQDCRPWKAYGDGVYLAREASTSMGSYAIAGRSHWQKSQSGPTNCVAVAEVVNLPSKFVSTNPHYVVKDTHWIMCRYLLVKGITEMDPPKAIESKGKGKKGSTIPYVKLDPNHKTSVHGKVIEIPDPAFKVETLLAERQADYVHEEPDEEDLAIFQLNPSKPSKDSQSQHHHDLDDEDDYRIPSSSSSKGKAVAPVKRPKDDWKHNSDYVSKTLENLYLPPFESSPGASMAIQRELKSMLKEQEIAPSLKDLGWYMPPELIGDNLYQWIVEMHSFDPALPIAKDLKQKKVNSIIFEIRFPPAFPNSPPFFRIITPRFLPFIQGGGGHVTGGGSVCMDLLTSDGWLPSYSISAVLMQIRLALSNLEPRPARLAQDWNRPYDVHESLAGFKRAAATHNWKACQGHYREEEASSAQEERSRLSSQESPEEDNPKDEYHDINQSKATNHGNTGNLIEENRNRWDDMSAISFWRKRYVVVLINFEEAEQNYRDKPAPKRIVAVAKHVEKNMFNWENPEAPTKSDVKSLPQDTLDFARRMFEAAREGDSTLLLSAIDAGLPANLTNEKGNTLLMLAAYAGHTDLAKGLLEKGGDPTE